MEETSPGAEERLSRLSRGADEIRNHDQRYSRFIRSLRIALPLAALSIVAVVFSWGLLQENDIAPPVQESGRSGATIGKNELLNPRFESIDEKNQPFTITAARAVQGQDDDMMLLESPEGEMKLNSGDVVSIRAQQGAFRQETQRLLLKNDVTLLHDDGYRVQTQELDIDLDDGTSQTDLAIAGAGPTGTLEASGMRGDSKAETLIFNGPAKLVIFDAGSMEVLSP